MVNPQIWNAYSYVANNPFKFIDPFGEELVPLGVHTDDEIKKLIKQYKKDIKNTDDKDVKKNIKAKIKTLELEKEGNGIAQAYLDRLDAVGQRDGLKLTDLVLSTDTKNDLSGRNISQTKMAELTSSDTKAFTLNRGGPIYLRSESDQYKNSSNDILMQDLGGCTLRHEREHVRGFGEYIAYRVQREVFQYFRNDFYQNRNENKFNEIDNMLLRAIDYYAP